MHIVPHRFNPIEALDTVLKVLSFVEPSSSTRQDMWGRNEIEQLGSGTCLEEREVGAEVVKRLVGFAQ